MTCALCPVTVRKANTYGLRLAEFGAVLDDRGAVIVDDHMRTSRPWVYAAGDVTNRGAFVYMAAHGAKIATRNALNGDGSTYDNRAMPWVVFTDPQVAAVGVTEAAARDAGYDVRTSTITLDQVPRALAARDTRGMFRRNRLMAVPPLSAKSGTLATAGKQRIRSSTWDLSIARRHCWS